MPFVAYSQQPVYLCFQQIWINIMIVSFIKFYFKVIIVIFKFPLVPQGEIYYQIKGHHTLTLIVIHLFFNFFIFSSLKDDIFMSSCSNSCTIHVSEKAGKTGETLQWSTPSYELWGHLIITTIKEIKSSSRAWKEAWGCERTKPCGRDRATERGKDPPRSTPSQFFQESVSMRQLRGEAFISLMHCITAGPLEKAPSLRGWMKKIRIWIPTPLNRLGSCEQPHISSHHVALWSLQAAVGTIISPGSKSVASAHSLHGALRDQSHPFQDHQASSSGASSQAP